MDLGQIHKRLLLKNMESMPLINYEPATLKEWATGWVIEYRVLNPDLGILERKRIKFEKIRKRLGSDVKARKYAKVYCDAINEKLESGWNPYLDVKNVKSFHKLTDALTTYLKEKKLDEKNGIFRNDSIRTYESYINVFLRWLTKTKREDVYVGSFSKDLGQKYLDYLYVENELAPRTYNNYLSFMRTLWGWLKEKEYCSENFFLDIKTKPNTEKERKIIPMQWSNKIMEYFRKNNPTMELVCGLVYNSFMRPSEICRTQISDIRIAQGGIFLPGKKAKNGHARWCLLPPHLIEILINLGIDKYPLDYYLISTRLKPGKTPLTTRKLDKYWHKMRKAIELPMEMKLYSYRDTGITDLKTQGHSNLFISSITGHLNSDEIETYTHAPDPKALLYIMEKSKQL